jgi:hypothetical protein
MSTGADDVRSWGRTGSDRPMLKMALLTHSDRLLIGLLRRITGNLKHSQPVNAQSIDLGGWVLCIGIYGSGVKSDGAS